ncbi:MAG: hypothetical protein J5911_01345 [Clostridia bacterium]|nr:hypothetical protein [Clostridia bacterium]
MNSQRQNDKKKKTASAVFTKETLGVVTVLFATLCVICLITKDAVFSAPGKYIGDFLMGVFGYFAYPVGIFAIFKGVMLVLGKKTGISFKRRALIFLSFLFVALFAQIVSMGGEYQTLGDYLSASYSLGENSFSAGGVAAGLGGYFLQSLLTVVGSAVITGGAFFLCVYFLIADIVKDGKRVRPEREFRTSYVNKKQSEDTEPAPVQTPVQTPENTATPVSARKPEQELFIGDGEDFSFKSKREMQKESGEAFKVGSDGKSLNVSQYSGSYSEGFTKDLKEKIEYIKTPSPIKIDRNHLNENTSGPRVSDYISTKAEEPEMKTEAAQGDTAQGDIPMIEHDTSFMNDAKSRAAAFGERYASSDLMPEKSDEPVIDGGAALSDEPVINDEPAERFTKPVNERERTIEDFTETPVASEDETPKGRFDMENNAAAEEDNISEKFDFPEEPPTSRIRERRSRRLLLGDENTDDNGSRTEDLNLNGRVNDDEISGNGFSGETEEPKRPSVMFKWPTYRKPPLDLLDTYAPPADAPQEDHEGRMRTIVKLLDEFHISVEPVGYIQGPSITRYEVKLAPGIPVRKVASFDNDFKMRLESKSGIIIQAPIPGRDGVGIEVANKYKTTVGLKDVLQGDTDVKIKPGSLIFALGEDIVGKPKMDDLVEGPHYLVAGSTGSGKSVCLNVMIVSMLMRYSPEELRFILVDPKRVGFRKYEHLPHLLIDEIITEPQRAVAALEWAVQEMERRYSEFEKVEGGLVGDIETYNQLVANDTVPKMPKIVIVVDELADLMEYCKKDMESGIRRLAAKSRMAGIHLVLATQRPSVDVVTGIIKNNLPCRIALKVTSPPDSTTILNAGGAEKLLGKGDMLYKDREMDGADAVRYQGAWLSDMEIVNVVSFIKENNPTCFDDDLKNYLDKAVRAKQEETAAGVSDEEEGDTVDDFFLKALWFAVTSKTIAISQLQRHFQIGYARAGGLVDKMERMGFVSGNEGSKARTVLLSREEFEERFGEPPVLR